MSNLKRNIFGHVYHVLHTISKMSSILSKLTDHELDCRVSNNESIRVNNVISVNSYRTRTHCSFEMRNPDRECSATCKYLDIVVITRTISNVLSQHLLSTQRTICCMKSVICQWHLSLLFFTHSLSVSLKIKEVKLPIQGSHTILCVVLFPMAVFPAAFGDTLTITTNNNRQLQLKLTLVRKTPTTLRRIQCHRVLSALPLLCQLTS